MKDPEPTRSCQLKCNLSKQVLILPDKGARNSRDLPSPVPTAVLPFPVPTAVLQKSPSDNSNATSPVMRWKRATEMKEIRQTRRGNDKSSFTHHDNEKETIQSSPKQTNGSRDATVSSVTSVESLFITVVGRSRHTNLRTGEKPYKCDICHKAYTSKSGLTNHHWYHVEDKPHKCDDCPQSFGHKQQLRIHSRSHTGEKPYSCDICAKSFSDLRCLSKHRLRHSGEKHYSCQVCGKRFSLPAKLKQHEKIHTQREKPHSL
uniref:C2H2-type domain-containing protein n=1 Tax=Monopterus albus TaxID=43700 RepID=A0A3Q3IV03_MONAL